MLPHPVTSRAALLGGVVVDDVEDDLDALAVQELDHALQLVDGTLRVLRGRIGTMGREEAEGVVAPVVGQPAAHQVRFVGERVHGQQLDGRHPEGGEVGHRRGVGQPGVRAPQLGGHTGVQRGLVADMGLVDDALAA